MVANTARGQLNREKSFSPCPRSRLRIWSRETGSAIPSHVRLLILLTQAESGAYSRDSSRSPRRRPHILPSTAIGSVPRLSGHANAYRWRSLPRVWINRARLPILLVVSGTGKLFFSLSPFAPKNLVSRVRQIQPSRPASARSFHPG